MEFVKYSIFEKIFVIFFVLVTSSVIIYFVANYTSPINTTDSNQSVLDANVSDYNLSNTTESNLIDSNLNSLSEEIETNISSDNESIDSSSNQTEREQSESTGSETTAPDSSNTSTQEETSVSDNDSDQETDDSLDAANQDSSNPNTQNDQESAPSNSEANQTTIAEEPSIYFSGEKVITLNNKNVFLSNAAKVNNDFYVVVSQPTQTQRPEEYDSDYRCHSYHNYKKYIGVVKLDAITGDLLWGYEKFLPVNNQIRESSIDIIESLFVEDGVILLYKLTDYSEIYSQNPNYPCMVEGPTVETYKILKVNFSGQEVFDIDLSYPIIDNEPYDYTYQYRALVSPNLYYPLSSSKNSFMIIFNKQKYLVGFPYGSIDYIVRDLYTSNLNYKVFSTNNGSLLFEKEFLNLQQVTNTIIKDNKMFLSSSHDSKTNLLKIDVLSGSVDFNKTFELFPYDVYCSGPSCPNGTITHYTQFLYNYLDSSNNSYYMVANGTHGSYSVGSLKPAIVKLNANNGEIIWSNDFSNFSYPYAGLAAIFSSSDHKLLDSIIKQNNNLLLPLGCLEGYFWRPCFAVINSSTGELINQKVIKTIDDFNPSDRNYVSTNFFANFFTNRFYNYSISDQKLNFLFKHHYNGAYYKVIVDPSTLDFRLKKLSAESLYSFYSHNDYMGGGTNLTGTSAYYSNNKNIIYGVNYSVGWINERARIFAVKHTDTHSKYYLSEKLYNPQTSFSFISNDQSVVFIFGNNVSHNSAVLVAIDLNS